MSGPGTELMNLLADLGISPTEDCDCHEKAEKMDAWGLSKCKDNRGVIIQWLRDGQGRWRWKARLRHIIQATRLAFKVSPLDPFPGLVDEALRRASCKGARRPESLVGHEPVLSGAGVRPT